MHKLFAASVTLALVAPFSARPDTSADLNAIRQEIGAMRAAYEARLQALEQRLKAAEAAASAAATSAAAVATPPAAASARGAAAATVPAPVSSGGSANAFNPAISLILSGLYTRTSQNPAGYAITGFPLPADAEIGPGSRSFSLAESELGFSASIDPWFRGAAHFAVSPDDTVAVEEAFVQTTSLGSGLSLKAGRFFSGVGYLNPKHAHAWDFVDNPLAYQALLGTQYGDDGVQLTWLAPLDRYLELGVELGRGRGFPGGGFAGNGAGMAALTAHAGDDVGTSHSWRAGLSALRVKASGQGLVATDATGAVVVNAFSGDTRVWVIDGVWKWAPGGNASRTSFTLQGEVLRSTRSGSLVYDVGNANSAGAYRAEQSGFYLQGVYQFQPRWRVGLRTERLDAGTPDYGINAGVFVGSGFRPRKNTLMVDFSPSEFSRLRLQLARDRAREGIVDNQLFLQYQMSLGAHAAHGY